MLHFHFLFMLLFFSVDGYTQKQMTLEIEIRAVNNIDTIFLVKGSNPYKKESLVDSISLTNNKGHLKIDLDEAGAYIMRTSLSKGVNLLFFFAIPGQKTKITWTIHGPQNSRAQFYNSSVNSVYHNEVTIPAANAIRKMNAYSDSVYQARISNDSSKRVDYLRLNLYWRDSLRNIYFEHIKLHPKNISALFLLDPYYKNFSDKEVAAILQSLPKKLRHHSLAKAIAFNKFTLEKVTSFAEFRLVDSSGKPFTYQDYMDKVVLVDFWASWCKPCLANIPIIESIRNKYQGQSFDVLGVSVDENKDAWLKSLKNNHVSWRNVLEPLAMKGMTAKYFKISEIPRYVLLSKGGLILVSDLHIADAPRIIEEALRN